MKQQMNCQEAREKIAGLNEGWLDRDEAERVSAHVEACPECRRQLELDKKLLASLGSLESARVPALRGEPRGARRPAVWRLAWLGPAAAAVAALAVWQAGKAPVAPPSQPVALATESKALDHMHMELTLSDAGSDPNRAILLAFSKKSGKELAQ